VTSPIQNAWKPVLHGEYEFPISTASKINAGDLVFFDLANTQGNGKVLAPITTENQATSSVGVCSTTTPVTSTAPTQYPLPQFAVVTFNDIYKFYSTSGDTINWLDALYIGASSQTLTNIAGTNIIGRAFFPPSDSNGNTITPPLSGATGTFLYATIKPLLGSIGIL
jgi:hypothetical protein